MMRRIELHTALGFTLIEVTVSMAMVSVLLGIAVLNLDQLVNPAQNGAAQLAGFIKTTRARAISSTAAYTLEAQSATRIVAKYSNSCSDVDFTYDPKMILNLPPEVSLQDMTWTVCFNSRGLPDQNITVPLEDIYNGKQTVEVFLGGAVRFNAPAAGYP